MAICPECEFDELEAEGVEQGETLACPECGRALVLVGQDEFDVVDEGEDEDEGLDDEDDLDEDGVASEDEDDDA